MTPLLSVVIPNRNSPFLAKTIQDVLDHVGCEVEVIVNIDEKWINWEVDDARVHYIHPSSPIGLRQGINACVEMAKGKYILKCDDHVAFGENFGRILIDNHQDNWVQIPRRYALNAEEWKIEERQDDKYPIDYMYLDFPRKGKDHDDGMHGVPWKRPKIEQSLSLTVSELDDNGKVISADTISIDETPSMQGSCYFMTRDHYLTFLGGLSEVGYGQFAQESQEIGLKTWLGGGKLIVNKKTWYAHLHKGQRYGRFYNFPAGTVEASSWSADYWLNNRWDKRVHDFSWFIDEKFPNMPSWPLDWKEQIKQMGWTK